MNDYWKTKFAWSNSRQKTWDGCRKRFYLYYIACWERSDLDLKSKIWELKKLTKMILWKGNLIHGAVCHQINRAKIGIELGMTSAVKQLEAEVDAAKKHKSKMFVEIVNGFQIEDQDFDLVLQEAKHQLQNFFELWPRWEGMEIITAEQNEKFDLMGIPVNIKIDVGFKTFDAMFINVDWKTGKTRPKEADESEAVGSYIIGTMNKHSVPVEAVTGELVYLRSGKVFETFRTEEQIGELQASIIKRSKIMLSAREESDFPASPGQYQCRDCEFATICPEGKEFIRI